MFSIDCFTSFSESTGISLCRIFVCVPSSNLVLRPAPLSFLIICVRMGVRQFDKLVYKLCQFAQTLKEPPKFLSLDIPTRNRGTRPNAHNNNILYKFSYIRANLRPILKLAIIRCLFQDDTSRPKSFSFLSNLLRWWL